MHDLEVPKILPGQSVQGNDRITEQIVSKAISAPALPLRRGKGVIDNAACRIDGGLSPTINGVIRLRMTVIVRGPSAVTGLAFLWDAAEVPQLFACDDIKTANILIAPILVWIGRADNDILINNYRALLATEI